MPLRIDKTLLLIIDVQRDFCAGGALAVPDGDAVVAPLNAMSRAFAAAGARVAATQDWHPAGHVSFASSHPGMKPGDLLGAGGEQAQALWPDHCVCGTGGADFHTSLDLDPVSLIVRKGFRPRMDSYSAFFENDRATPTGLGGWIRGLGIETVVIGGLATDYCVFYSSMDSVLLGLRVVVAEDAVRAVGLPAGSADAALAKMRTAGVRLAESGAIVGELC